MATRTQQRASTAPPASIAVQTKNGKPQQEIVDNSSLRRLYAIALQCRAAGHRGSHRGAANIAHAAASVELTGEDFIAAARESLALDLVRGGSVAASAQNNGDASTSKRAAAKIVAREGAGSSYLSIAAGVALGLKMAETRALVVVLADVETVTTGPSYEALDYASAQKLPLVTVVDNLCVTKGTRPDLTALAQAHGVPAFVVDGEDAVAVYRVAREAIHRARSGRGPSLIECRAFTTDEDPLRHLEGYLQKHGLWTPQWKREILADAEGDTRGSSIKGREM